MCMLLKIIKTYNGKSQRCVKIKKKNIIIFAREKKKKEKKMKKMTQKERQRENKINISKNRFI